jgi:hypothetical protein
MNRMPAFLDQAEFADVLGGRAARAQLVPAKTGGWHIMVRNGTSETTLAAQRGKPRHFARAETAFAYLQRLGVEEVSVSVKGYEPGRKSARTRPDRAAALKRAHEAAEYERWYREQVQIGIDSADRGEGEPAEVVFARVWADLEAKLAARKQKEKSPR